MSVEPAINILNTLKLWLTLSTLKCTDTAGASQGINHAADNNYRIDKCASLLHIQCVALPPHSKSKEFCFILLNCFFLLSPLLSVD